MIRIHTLWLCAPSSPARSNRPNLLRPPGACGYILNLGNPATSCLSRRCNNMINRKLRDPDVSPLIIDYHLRTNPQLPTSALPYSPLCALPFAANYLQSLRMHTCTSLMASKDGTQLELRISTPSPDPTQRYSRNPFVPPTLVPSPPSLSKNLPPPRLAPGVN